MLEILLDATVRSGTPILFATLGAIINERAGIINLGIEGLMLIGALAGFAGSTADAFTLFERFEGSDPNALIGLPLIQLVNFLANEGFSILE